MVENGGCGDFHGIILLDFIVTYLPPKSMELRIFSKIFQDKQNKTGASHPASDLPAPVLIAA